MKVEDWMTHRVHTVKPLDSIRHAREIMESQRINQLPVVLNGHLVGIVTDRDLRDAFPSVFAAAGAARVRQRGSAVDPDKISVEAVMTAEVLTVGPRDPVVAAAQQMRRQRIGALPVVDSGRLVGIIARSDVLDAFVALAESTQQPMSAGRK